MNRVVFLLIVVLSLNACSITNRNNEHLMIDTWPPVSKIQSKPSLKLTVQSDEVTVFFDVAVQDKDIDHKANIEKQLARDLNRGKGTPSRKPYQGENIRITNNLQKRAFFPALNGNVI